MPKKLQPYLYRWSRHEQVITSKFFQQEQAVPLLFEIIFFFSVRLPVSEATGKWLLYCIFHILSASLITVKVSLIFHFARLLVLCSLRCAIKKATSFLSKRDQQLLFVILLLVQLLQVVTFFNLSLEISEYCTLAHFIMESFTVGIRADRT